MGGLFTPHSFNRSRTDFELNRVSVNAVDVNKHSMHTDNSMQVTCNLYTIFQCSSGFVRGSGFIAELAVDGQKKCLLITCNHVLKSKSDALKADIYFGRVHGDGGELKIKGQDLFHDQFFKTDDKDVSLSWWLHHLLPYLHWYTLYAQDDEWGTKLDYTAVEVRMEVMEKHLKEKTPEPLSVTKYAEWKKKNVLRVDDQLYIVHYPKEQAYVRCTNAEHICVLQGKLAEHGLTTVKYLYHPHARTPQNCHLRHVRLTLAAGPYIGHIAGANPGSSGSPMLREHNNEWIVVGLHRGAIGADVNVATHIDLIVDDIQGNSYTGSGK